MWERLNTEPCGDYEPLSGFNSDCYGSEPIEVCLKTQKMKQVIHEFNPTEDIKPDKQNILH